jgi:predicted nuclease of restriction endonuclease-like (RecB) superfamily
MNRLLFQSRIDNKNGLEELPDSKKMSLDMFCHGSYMLHFLGLKDSYSEKDLKSAIL